jgi:hypothetical protein
MGLFHSFEEKSRLQRQSGSGFNTVELETGFAVLHTRVLEQGVHHEMRVGLHVAHHDFEQVVHLPSERGAFDHFGPGLHGGTK